MTILAERIWLVSYTLGASEPAGVVPTGWCWTWVDPNCRSELEREWHKLRGVPHCRETWAPGLYGDSQHLDKAKAAVEALVGRCVWPLPTMMRLRAHRRIVIDERKD